MCRRGPADRVYVMLWVCIFQFAMCYGLSQCALVLMCVHLIVSLFHFAFVSMCVCLTVCSSQCAFFLMVIPLNVHFSNCEFVSLCVCLTVCHLTVHSSNRELISPCICLTVCSYNCVFLSMCVFGSLKQSTRSRTRAFWGPDVLILI